MGSRNLTPEDREKLRARSKDDQESKHIVGSEVRAVLSDLDASELELAASRGELGVWHDRLMQKQDEYRKAVADNDALELRVAMLQRQLAHTLASRDGLRAMFETLTRADKKLLAEIETQNREIDELIKALEPFAELAVKRPHTDGAYCDGRLFDAAEIAVRHAKARRCAIVSDNPVSLTADRPVNITTHPFDPNSCEYNGG